MGENQIGFANEAEGYAASLRQQAAWVEESPAAEMIDADELRAAANFIERQQSIIAPAQSTRDRLAIALALINETRTFYDLNIIGWDFPDLSTSNKTRALRQADAVIAALRVPEAEAVVPDERNTTTDGGAK